MSYIQKHSWDNTITKQLIKRSQYYVYRIPSWICSYTSLDNKGPNLKIELKKTLTEGKRIEVLKAVFILSGTSVDLHTWMNKLQYKIFLQMFIDISPGVLVRNLNQTQIGLV